MSKTLMQHPMHRTNPMHFEPDHRLVHPQSLHGYFSVGEDPAEDISKASGCPGIPRGNDSHASEKQRRGQLIASFGEAYGQANNIGTPSMVRVVV